MPPCIMQPGMIRCSWVPLYPKPSIPLASRRNLSQARGAVSSYNLNLIVPMHSFLLSSMSCCDIWFSVHFLIVNCSLKLERVEIVANLFGLTTTCEKAMVIIEAGVDVGKDDVIW